MQLPPAALVCGEENPTHVKSWNAVASRGAFAWGPEVCNLIWSKNVNEIVSTHGYSLNQIILWKYPSMAKVPSQHYRRNGRFVQAQTYRKCESVTDSNLC